jgi:hypothetical protein
VPVKNIRSMGKWLSRQQQNYKNTREIMTNESIRKEWESFVSDEKYKKYFVSNPDFKADLLLKFVEENKRLPTKEEEYKGVKIGQFWASIKQGQSKKSYENKLSKNEILKADYDRVQKLKQEKKGKETLTPDFKADLLLEFVKENKRLPKNGEEYKGFKIRKFWDHIKQGDKKKLYEDKLSKNEILKADYDRVQKLKQEKEGKETLTLDFKADLLLEFVEENKKVPKQGEEYKGVKIGRFWDNIKQGRSKELYENKLSKNEILKADYDRVQKLKQEKKAK